MLKIDTTYVIYKAMFVSSQYFSTLAKCLNFHVLNVWFLPKAPIQMDVGERLQLAQNSQSKNTIPTSIAFLKTKLKTYFPTLECK